MRLLNKRTGDEGFIMECASSDEARELVPLIKEWAREGGVLLVPLHIVLYFANGMPVPIQGVIDDIKGYKVKEWIGHEEWLRKWREIELNETQVSFQGITEDKP